jgi:transposase
LGNYLKVPDRQRILALLELGWTYRRVERETGVRRETIAKYARALQSNPANPTTGSAADLIGQGNSGGQKRPNPTAGSAPGPPSACEPFRTEIAEMISRGLTAQRIWQELCTEYGFAHGYESVKRFVRHERGRRPEVADVMEHPPGKEGQVDYFKSPAPVLNPTTGKWGRPWIFRMTLSCSRHGYEEPMWRQQRDDFLRAHEHAFLRFGGVPEVVRLDNLKAGVARACLYDPDVNDVYAAFARHWGFVPLPCRPYHPEENGIEERSGGYVKSNGLKGKRFDTIEALAAHLCHWNTTVAQLRIHGTTRRQVIRHFLEVEKPALRPLPADRFSLFEVGTRRVHDDGHVEVKAAFYSVPHTLVGREVRVHWDGNLVRVYRDGTAIAVHTRIEAGSWSTRPEHRPVHKPARQEAYEATQLARIEKIGPQVLAWAKEAVLERDVRSYRLLQGVLRLTRTHPKERIDWACGVALERRAFRYQTLKRLTEEAATRAQQPQLRQRHELIRDLVEYRSVMTTTHQPVATRQTPAAVRAGDARNDPSMTSTTWETTP